jgi:translation initiation factor IF-2
MTAVLEVIPFAVFNRQGPILAAVRVVKGPLVRQMTVTVSGTQKVLGVVVDIHQKVQSGMVEALEGVVGETYAVKIEPMSGHDAPRLEDGETTLVCSL